jgi:butyryl-CoA dehydrogenase
MAQLKTLPPDLLPPSYLLQPMHHEFRQNLRRFLADHVEPVCDQYEADQKFPHDILALMAKEGYLGVPFPKEYGGMGKDSLCLAIMIEELSRVWGSLGIILAAHIGLGSSPIYNWGNEEQKKKYLPPLARGERLGGYGLTEPGAGSDSGATKTKAVLEGDTWVINGAKAWCTNATEAFSYVVSAVTDSDKGKGAGISAFIVERGFEGFSFGKKEDKMGLRSSATGVLLFENCRVPAENLLGQLGSGFKYFMQTLDGGRITIGAMALGLGYGALEEAVKATVGKNYTQDLWANEYKLAPLAEIATQLAAARQMIYNAALAKDSGQRYTQDGAMAKWFASEVAMKATDRIIEYMAEQGLSMNTPVSRHFRDAKLCTIGEGTNEICRVVIAREMLKHYSTQF